MRYDIRYRTEYRYAGRVTDNMNAVRVQPANSATQTVTGVALAVDPPARIDQRRDYFGTVVHEFDVIQPHQALAVDVASHVQVTAPPPPPDPAWESLDHPGYRNTASEFLTPHEAARPHPLLDRLAQEARRDTPRATALALAELVPDTFEYRRGVTYVGSTVADLIAAGAGVCQDFVHLTLAVLRNMGIAGRYCSGYLFAGDGNGDGVESVEVETHAWLEVMLPTGPVSGVWVGIDPTNRGLVADRHVKIGHGRWYSDVPPIRGIFRGPPGGDLSARVTMTRITSDPVAPEALAPGPVGADAMP
jgi:transglutaminase-like putative cysteine protease